MSDSPPRVPAEQPAAESGRPLFRAAVAATWIVGTADVVEVLLAIPPVPRGTRYALQAVLATLAYATLVGLTYGGILVMLLELRARLYRTSRRMAILLHPAVVLGLLWSAVTLRLTRGPGISGSPWRIPLLVALVLSGLGGLAICTWLYRRGQRHPLRRWRVWLVTGLIIGTGVAYVSGFFYAQQYDVAHAFFLLLAIASMHLALLVLAPATWKRRSRRSVMLALGLGVAAMTCVVLLPLHGTSKELAFRRSQLVHDVLLIAGHFRPANDLSAFAPTAGTEEIRIPICTGTPRQAYDIVLLSVDALRADRLAAGGADRVVTPNLDRIGAEGLVFPSGYSPSPATSTSLMSLLTGNSAVTLREVGELTPTLASELRRLGYETHTFVNLDICKRVFPGLKVRQLGFDEVHRVSNSEELATKAIELLSRPRDRPLFIYHHLGEPHAPYQRHSGHNFGSRLEDRYDSEVAYVDEQIGRIYDETRRLGRGDRTIIAVTADHADAFFEHGVEGHATTLYEEMIRVPIVISAPDLQPAVVDEPTSVLDLAPTLLALVGCGWSTAQEGHPLWADGALREPSSPVTVYQYDEYERGAQFVRRVATLAGHDKLIEDRLAGVAELYDLESDPGETANLISSDRGRLDALHAAKARAGGRIAWVVQERSRVRRSPLARKVAGGDPTALEMARRSIVSAPAAVETLALIDALAESPPPASTLVLRELLSSEAVPPPVLRRIVHALQKQGAYRDADWIALARSVEASDTGRAEAIAILAKFDSPDARTAIADLLDARSDSVAAAAAAAECSMDGLRAATSAKIRARFPQRESLEPLEVAAVQKLLSCVAAVPSPENIDYLVDLYGDGGVMKRKGSVYLVIEALGHAGSDRPLPLLERLARSGWTPIRRRAIEAIAALNTPGARSFLVDYAGKNLHFDLDNEQFHALLLSLTETVTRIDAGPASLAIPGPHLPLHLSNAVRHALRDTSTASRVAALLALHLRRQSADRPRGRLLLSVGSKQVASVPLAGFGNETSSIVYLPLSLTDDLPITVQYTMRKHAPLELTAAEVLWLQR